MQKLTKAATVISIIICLAVAVFSALFLPPKDMFYAAIVIIVLILIPFFLIFEGRRITTLEMVLLATMIAFAVVSRVIFAFAPQVKPMAAFVVVAAAAFGPNPGFVAGALSIFVSNFFLGQGLYTPFQMVAMGLVGLICGSVLKTKSQKRSVLFVSIFSGVVVAAVYGIIVDACSVIFIAPDFTFSSISAVYLSGLPFNLIHGATTAIILALIYRPMMNKFDRLSLKYGVFENS